MPPSTIAAVFAWSLLFEVFFSTVVLSRFIEIAGEAPPLLAIGAVPVTPVTPVFRLPISVST